jgi:hypothetical protein
MGREPGDALNLRSVDVVARLLGLDLTPVPRMPADASTAGCKPAQQTCAHGAELAARGTLLPHTTSDTPCPKDGGQPTRLSG